MYILRDSGRIVGFGEQAFVVGDGQTQEESDSTMSEYAARFCLEANKRQIAADGLDEAVVLVRSNLGVADVDVSVNGTVVNVVLVNGLGVLPAISSAAPGFVEVKPSDETEYSAAGEGSLVIQAV